MKPKLEQVVLGGLILIWLTVSIPLQGQVSILTGTVTDAAGKAVANAKVSVKNAATGASAQATTGADGTYSVADLAAGEYEVSVSAQGFGTKTSEVTLPPGAAQTMDVRLSASAATPSQDSNSSSSANTLPNAPSSSQGPSLSDLGFTPEQTQANAKEQALLDKRTHMLKIHQRLGLITTVPLVAAVVLGPGAGGKQTSKTSRDLHVGVGALAGDLYFTTAYFAIFAPKIPGTPTRGPIRVHKILAWVHGPGMILTPILGTMAFEQKSRGEKVHGLAAAHGPVAIATAGAFGAALLSVSVKF